MSTYNSEYGWARRREQVNELLTALINGLKVGESLAYPWLKAKVRASVDLKPGFEANSLHAMTHQACKKAIATGKYAVFEFNGVKQITRNRL